MKKKLRLGCFLIVIVFAACKKDSIDNTDNNNGGEDSTQIIPVSEYFPMQVGNYWIYRSFGFDTSGNEVWLSSLDSILITKDTIINSNTYFKFEYDWPHEVAYFRRDSAGFLIDEHGICYFTTTNSKDTLSHFFVGDSALELIFIMSNDTVISTPELGTQNVMQLNEYVISGGVSQLMRFMPHYFLKNTGDIRQDFTIPGIAWDYQRRLIRYHIQ